MKILGITQRVQIASPHNERRDCLDQRWWRVSRALGFTPLPLPNVPNVKLPSFFKSIKFSAIIFSGGNTLGFLNKNSPDNAFERDTFELNLIEWALDLNIPILGVCRGMQIINHYYGGSLKAVNKHVSEQHAITFCGDLSGELNREVNSYHNWGISSDNLGENLEALAVADDETVELFQHTSKRVAGMMWHPERESKLNQFDSRIMKKFLL